MKHLRQFAITLAAGLIAWSPMLAFRWAMSR